MPTIILRPGEASAKDIQLLDVSSGITVAVTIIYLDTLEAVEKDIKLRDPNVQPAAPASEFTGTLAGSLSLIVGSASASHGVTSTASGVFSLVTGSFAASHGVTSTLAGSVSTITGAATAAHGVAGTISGSLTLISGSWAADTGIVLAMAGNLSAVSGDWVAAHDAGVQPLAGGGGGGRRSRPVRSRGRRWRDPLYLTAELQADLEGEEQHEEETDEEVASELISEAITVFGGLLKPVGGLVDLPEPPKSVVKSVVAAPVIEDWKDILEAIQDAQRRAQTKIERERIKRYRVKMEAARVEVARRVKNEEEAAEFLMVGGWL